MDKRLIKQVNKCYIIDLSNVIYCKSISNYSHIQLKEEKSIITTKCLTQLSKELNMDFIRISQSCLVNIHYIVEIISPKKQVLITTGEYLDFTIKYSDLCNTLESRFKSQTENESTGNRVQYFGPLLWNNKLNIGNYQSNQLDDK